MDPWLQGFIHRAKRMPQHSFHQIGPEHTAAQGQKDLSKPWGRAPRCKQHSNRTIYCQHRKQHPAIVIADPRGAGS